MSWTNVSKPTGSSYTNISKPSDGGTVGGAGYATGTLGLTYFEPFIASQWISVQRPQGANWTNINKPT